MSARPKNRLLGNPRGTQFSPTPLFCRWLPYGQIFFVFLRNPKILKKWPSKKNGKKNISRVPRKTQIFGHPFVLSMIALWINFFFDFLASQTLQKLMILQTCKKTKISLSPESWPIPGFRFSLIIWFCTAKCIFSFWDQKLPKLVPPVEIKKLLMENDPLG